MRSAAQGLPVRCRAGLRLAGLLHRSCLSLASAAPVCVGKLVAIVPVVLAVKLVALVLSLCNEHAQRASHDVP